MKSSEEAAELSRKETLGKSSKWYHIDFETIPSKVAYFMFGVKDAMYSSYVILFLVDVGLSTSQAGLVSGLSLIGSMLGAVFWGMLTDWSRKRRLVLLVVVIGSSSCMTLLPFVPQAIKTVGENCSSYEVNNQTNSSILIESEMQYCRSTSEWLFVTMLCIYVVISFFDGFLSVHVDANVMIQVSKSKGKVDAGWQRAWFCVGYGVAAFSFGAMLKLIPSDARISRYSIQHFIYACSALGLMLNSHFLFKRTETEAELEVKKVKNKETNIGSLLLKTIFKFHVFFFMATLFYLAMSVSLSINYISVLIKEKNAPDILFGLLMVVSSVSTFIMYSVSTRVIEFFGGTFQIMLVSAVTNIIKFAIFGFAQSPYVMMVGQLLHPFTFSLSIVAAVHHTKVISPKEITNSMFGIINSIVYGGGAMMAYIIGGTIYQMYGGQNMYKGAMFLSVFWAILLIFFIVFNRKSVSKKDIGASEGLLNEVSVKSKDDQLS